MIEAIISDVDGVIIDSEAFKMKAWEETLKDYGIQDGGEWYRQRIGTGRQALAEMVLELGLPENLIDEFSNQRRAFYYNLIERESVPVIDSTVRFINSIPKDEFKLGAASSNPLHIIEGHLRNVGIRYLFDAIVSGTDDVARDKPYPDVYFFVAKKLKVSPERCLGIEDSGPGVEAVKGAGMKCIGFRNPNSGDQDLSEADMIVDDLSKLSVEEAVSLVSI